MDVPFVPGLRKPSPLPLERFLPPLPVGMITNWIKPTLPKGTWILDPFGNSPTLSMELADAGYRVLVCANNPIHAFILEILSTKPESDEFRETLQILAESKIGGEESCESFVRSYYQVKCENCSNILEVDFFLWRKDEEQPFGYIGTCPSCGISTEQSFSKDISNELKPLPTLGLHRARALESVVPVDDPLRSQVQNALYCYPNRPIVLIQVLLNKINGLHLNESQKRILEGCMLIAFDKLNTLWSFPTARTRPKQLVIPQVYLEQNVWKALEESVDIWSHEQKQVNLKEWPDLPPLSGGISLYKGRLRELDPQPTAGMFQSIVAILPRPNQAFWTLSAVWTGWLWGKEAVLPVKNVLGRQRYDWNWHANALLSMFQTLHRMTLENTPLFMLILENELDFLTAAMVSADSAGFKLNQIAKSGDNQIIQTHWKNGMPVSKFEDQESIVVNAKLAINDYLEQRGEPASYQSINTAILKKFHQNNLLSHLAIQGSEINISNLHKEVDPIFKDPDFLVRYSGTPTSLETGLYWLSNSPKIQTSIIDRVELTIISLLQESLSAEFKDIRAAVYQACWGLLTPPDELILACLNAYADPQSDDSNLWQLREGEDFLSRQKDLVEIQQRLSGLADSLGYKKNISNNTQRWMDEKDTSVYCFHFTNTADIGQFIYNPDPTVKKEIIVLPGSRANLLAYKLKRDPLLQATMTEHWQCVKFRQIRTLAENPLINRELFALQIMDDPPEYQAKQMVLL